MRRLDILRRAALVALACEGAAFAAPTSERPDSTVEKGTQVHSAKADRETYERLRKAARPPLRPGFVLAPGNSKPVAVKGRLHSFEDGMVLIAVPVSKKKESVLRKVGAREVNAPSAVGHHTIYQNHYYQEYRVAPAAGQSCAGCVKNRIVGPNPEWLKRRIGASVELELRRDRDGRAWVSNLKF